MNKNILLLLTFCAAIPGPIQSSRVAAGTERNNAMIEQIKQYARWLGGSLSEKKGIFTLEIPVAERKAFLSRKKLTYIARWRVDDAGREVRFTACSPFTKTGANPELRMTSPGSSGALRAIRFCSTSTVCTAR